MKHMMKEILEQALRKYFEYERGLRGDSFATEKELAALTSDPIGSLQMLRGVDAYGFVHGYLLPAQESESLDMSLKDVREQLAAVGVTIARFESIRDRGIWRHFMTHCGIETCHDERRNISIDTAQRLCSAAGMQCRHSENDETTCVGPITRIR